VLKRSGSGITRGCTGPFLSGRCGPSTPTAHEVPSPSTEATSRTRRQPDHVHGTIAAISPSGVSLLRVPWRYRQL